MLLSLDEFFSGRWEFGTAYIETGEFVPAALQRAGKYEAEVISEQALKDRYRGKNVAPALTRVQVRDTPGSPSVISVDISYNGVSTEGAKSVPIGGGETYWYKLQAGKPSLVRRVSTQY